VLIGVMIWCVYPEGV